MTDDDHPWNIPPTKTGKEWIARIRAQLEAMARPARPLHRDHIPIPYYNEPPPTAEQIGAEADPDVAYPPDPANGEHE